MYGLAALLVAYLDEHDFNEPAVMFSLIIGLILVLFISAGSLWFSDDIHKKNEKYEAVKETLYKIKEEK